MFGKLEPIDWPKLETAYGTAEAIPGALRDLASPDEEVYAAARQTLWPELEHQGTVFQASAYAAPFLIAWLSEAPSEAKCDLVTFLAKLARGNSYKRQHLNLTDERRQQDPVFQQEMAEEIRWVELTHLAVWEKRTSNHVCLLDTKYVRKFNLTGKCVPKSLTVSPGLFESPGGIKKKRQPCYNGKNFTKEARKRGSLYGLYHTCPGD